MGHIITHSNPIQDWIEAMPWVSWVGIIKEDRSRVE